MSNLSAPAPPPGDSSLFDTYVQPPVTGKHAPPSGAPCQVYDVPGTTRPLVATNREENPDGSWMPSGLAARSTP